MLVFMPSPLANTLEHTVSTLSRLKQRKQRTDLVMGDLAKEVGLKLKMPFASSIEMLVWLPALSIECELYKELVSEGESGLRDDAE